MKKILFLTPYVPSNSAGGENFTRLLLDRLSCNNHIDLIYFKYKDDPLYECPNENIKILKIIRISTFKKILNCLSYPSVHPIFSVRFNPLLLKYLKVIINNDYDLLYLDHSQLAIYGKFFPNINKVLMSHDVMAQRFGRKSNKLVEKIVIKNEKRMLSYPNTVVFTFSNKDKKIIDSKYDIESKVTNFILDTNVINAVPKKIKKQLVFFGKWKRNDNFYGIQWFFENVYHKVSKDFKFVIIGKWLPQSFINKINNYSNVEYLGFVDNPYNIISNSLAVISPLFSGAGVKVKVVESLACGTPVIGNLIAFEGIDPHFSEFMINANTSDEFANRISDLEITLEKRIMFKDKFNSLYNENSIDKFISNI